MTPPFIIPQSAHTSDERRVLRADLKESGEPALQPVNGEIDEFRAVEECRVSRTDTADGAGPRRQVGARDPLEDVDRQERVDGLGRKGVGDRD